MKHYKLQQGAFHFYLCLQIDKCALAILKKEGEAAAWK